MSCELKPVRPRLFFDPADGSNNGEPSRDRAMHGKAHEISIFHLSKQHQVYGSI